jgi:hypothetical protein
MSKIKQQTAVQLIIEALDIECKSRGMNVNWDMYLELEKEQIMIAYGIGAISENISIEVVEQYYNETYGGGEQ